MSILIPGPKGLHKLCFKVVLGNPLGSALCSDPKLTKTQISRHFVHRTTHFDSSETLSFLRLLRFGPTSILDWVQEWVCTRTPSHFRMPDLRCPLSDILCKVGYTHKGQLQIQT